VESGKGFWQQMQQDGDGRLTPEDRGRFSGPRKRYDELEIHPGTTKAGDREGEPNPYCV